MALFRHPHLVRGVVHTPIGAFRIERGVADLPDEVASELGWVAVATEPEPERARPAADAPARSRVQRAPLDPDAGALDTILAAVQTVVRGRRSVELPARGIDIGFDGGVFATCRRCRVSWEVSARRFKNLAWWSCPHGCAREAEAVNGSSIESATQRA